MICPNPKCYTRNTPTTVIAHVLEWKTKGRNYVGVCPNCGRRYTTIVGLIPVPKDVFRFGRYPDNEPDK